MHATVTSPFKFLMGSSHSAPDMSVNALVDRFTTLEVKDRDEDSAKRTVRRLEAALRRAEMAREEAETEATSLRDELREQRDMAEERLREKTDLRQRLDEYEVRNLSSPLGSDTQLTCHDRKSTKRPRSASSSKKLSTKNNCARCKRNTWSARSYTGDSSNNCKKRSSGTRSCALIRTT